MDRAEQAEESLGWVFVGFPLASNEFFEVNVDIDLLEFEIHLEWRVFQCGRVIEVGL